MSKDYPLFWLFAAVPNGVIELKRTLLLMHARTATDINLDLNRQARRNLWNPSAQSCGQSLHRHNLHPFSIPRTTGYKCRSFIQASSAENLYSMPSAVSRCCRSSGSDIGWRMLPTQALPCRSTMWCISILSQCLWPQTGKRHHRTC